MAIFLYFLQYYHSVNHIEHMQETKYRFCDGNCLTYKCLKNSFNEFYDMTIKVLVA